MGFHKAPDGIKRRANRPHGIGHGRQGDRHAFQSVTLSLTVQGLMLTELLEHDHGQEARPRPSPGDDMEWRRRLRDLLAVAAGELLPHGLDHLPLARLCFQRPGHVLAEFAQAIAAAAFAGRRRIDHNPLAEKMIGERVALGALARKSGDRRRLGDRLLRRQFVFRGAGLQLLERERQLLDQTRRAFRSLPVYLALQLGDPQFLLGDQRHVFGRLGARDRQFGGNFQTLRALDDQRRLQGVDVIGKCVASRVHTQQRIIYSVICGALKCA